MLKNISWTDYIVTVSAIFFIYYLYISIRYYSDEIKNFLSGKQKLRPSLNTDRAYDSNIEQPRDYPVSFENDSDESNTGTEQLTERLKSVIADAMDRQLIPQEFKQYLSMVLKEYPSIRYSADRSCINELIVSECKKYGTAILSEDEVELLWKEGM
jgi:hypothetical protein